MQDNNAAFLVEDIFEFDAITTRRKYSEYESLLDFMFSSNRTKVVRPASSHIVGQVLHGEIRAGDKVSLSDGTVKEILSLEQSWGRTVLTGSKDIGPLAIVCEGHDLACNFGTALTVRTQKHEA